MPVLLVSVGKWRIIAHVNDTFLFLIAIPLGAYLLIILFQTREFGGDETQAEPSASGDVPSNEMVAVESVAPLGARELIADGSSSATPVDTGLNENSVQPESREIIAQSDLHENIPQSGSREILPQSEGQEIATYAQPHEPISIGGNGSEAQQPAIETLKPEPTESEEPSTGSIIEATPGVQAEAETFIPEPTVLAETPAVSTVEVAPTGEVENESLRVEAEAPAETSVVSTIEAVPTAEAEVETFEPEASPLAETSVVSTTEAAPTAEAELETLKSEPGAVEETSTESTAVAAPTPEAEIASAASKTVAPTAETESISAADETIASLADSEIGPPVSETLAPLETEAPPAVTEVEASKPSDESAQTVSTAPDEPSTAEPPEADQPEPELPAGPLEFPSRGSPRYAFDYRGRLWVEKKHKGFFRQLRRPQIPPEEPPSNSGR